MTTLKTLTILTLIFNGLILIGMGHGFGPVIFIEILTFVFDFSKDLKINMLGNYEERIIPFSFFSIIVHLLLIISFFVKSEIKKRLLNYALILAFLNITFFTYDFLDNSFSLFTLISSTPFIIIGLILFLKLNIKNLNKKKF